MDIANRVVVPLLKPPIFQCLNQYLRSPYNIYSDFHEDLGLDLVVKRELGRKANT